MARYRIAVALLCGAGFSSLLQLLLKVSSGPIMSGVLGVLLSPGGVLADVLLNPRDFSPPLAVLAANGLVYSGIAFITVLACCRNVNAASMRLAMIRLAVPVAVLVCLACLPQFNALWPHGISELTKQEKELQEALPMGMRLSQAQDVLRSKGIESTQYEAFETVVLKRETLSITAVPGDRVLLARLGTSASQFPCSYEIEVILIFGPDAKLKQPYIQRLRLCP